MDMLKNLFYIFWQFSCLHPIQPGKQLYAGDNRGGWVTYNNFDTETEWLIGMLGTDMVNGGNSTNNDMFIAVKANITAFLIRTDGWSGVSLSNWQQIGTFGTLLSGYTDTFQIYTRTFTPGNYLLNTYSALYAFMI